MNRRHQLLVLSALIALAGCSGGKHEAVSTATEAPISVTVQSVAKQPTDDLYEATGSVRPLLRSDLSAKVVARVEKVLVRPGDKVTKGQLLVVLDARDLAASAAMAQASQRAAVAGAQTAQTAAAMEAQASVARIRMADANVAQAKAALAGAIAKLDLAKAGPRTQEKAQAELAVQQAQSSLRYAESELNRARALEAQGAIPLRELESAQNAYDLAKAQFEMAVESKKIALEGTREQDLRAAQEAVQQAQAALKQAEAAAQQARAASMQVQLRQQEARSAAAQVGQSNAAVAGAQVAVSFARIVAPFDGVVVSRSADPGSIAAPGAPLLSLEGGGYRLEASIPERLLSAAAIGTTVDVNLESSKGFVQATTAEIVPQGDIGSHTFTVKFALAEGQRYVSGQFGRAQIVTGKHDAILIPIGAVRSQNGLKTTLVAGTDDLARLRLITLGSEHKGMVEVLSGLEVGDRVILNAPASLRDGSRITVASR